MNWLRAMFVEIFAILAIIFLQILGFFWKAHFRSIRTGTPILLVHGYINTSAIWIYLKWKLRGVAPIYTIDLQRPFASIVDHAKQVAKMATRIEKETGKHELILIGYSMGGLVSTYYTTKLSPKRKVQKIITISTPFKGTHLAKIAIGINGRQMRKNSAFCRELKPSHIPMVTIGSKTDEFVVPYFSAFLESAKQIVFQNLGHAALIFSPRVANVLLKELSN